MNRASHIQYMYAIHPIQQLKEAGRPKFNYSCSIHLIRECVFQIDYG